ncbi:hypothetical protein P280DRAFT_300595 [Massarina eburnea CBS 473.64]|uniref:Uncharacterized protein n=1 Tax=Massarina eburnea CBS 473.64 TaxID=1395130 RepID=A0A6A6S3R2_9PLEO|nr:hypothetical protein P280DRAFT_300595 [Massarina eburnea CBS 473.64]
MHMHVYVGVSVAASPVQAHILQYAPYMGFRLQHSTASKQCRCWPMDCGLVLLRSSFPRKIMRSPSGAAVRPRMKRPHATSAPKVERVEETMALPRHRNRTSSKKARTSHYCFSEVDRARLSLTELDKGTPCVRLAGYHRAVLVLQMAEKRVTIRQFVFWGL